MTPTNTEALAALSYAEAAKLLANELDYKYQRGIDPHDGEWREAVTLLHSLSAVEAERDALVADAERQPLTEWQPIETAPKDGTRLILSDGKFVGAGVWVGRYFAWGVSPEPTHWMPLPAAPGTTTGEQHG